jgi:hypothetical protein
MSIGENKPDLDINQIVAAVVNQLRNNTYAFPNVLPIWQYGNDIDLTTVQGVNWINDLNNPTMSGPITSGTLRYYKLFVLNGPDSDIKWYIITVRGITAGGNLPQTFYIQNMGLFYHTVEPMLVTNAHAFIAKVSTSLNPPPAFANQSFWFIFSGV